MSDQDAEIDALYDAWRRAFRERDVDALLALVTEDYVLWAPGQPPIGVEALRPQLIAAFAAYDIEPAFERDERLVSGDLAVELGWDVQTVRPRDGGAAHTRRQRVFLALRRTDGRWRFARGMSQPGPAA
jgi:uncharacterized protein (TIGR02246 family)